MGDRFLMIVDGKADVTRDGEHLTYRSAGEHVGEVALLRDVPRTATVTAVTPMKLLTLDREAFLEAVTGHPQSHERAEAIVEERLPDEPATSGPARSRRPSPGWRRSCARGSRARRSRPRGLASGTGRTRVPAACTVAVPPQAIGGELMMSAWRNEAPTATTWTSSVAERTPIDRAHVALEHDLVSRRSPDGYPRPPGLLELTERVGNLDLRLSASRAARSARDGREIAFGPRLSRCGQAEGQHQRQQWDQASRPFHLRLLPGRKDKARRTEGSGPVVTTHCGCVVLRRRSFAVGERERP